MRKRIALAVGLQFLATHLMANDPTEFKELETITFGAGCFWCVEAVFQRLDGVESAVSGYMGGHVENPTYKAVTTGKTGHAEVIQVKFDPSVTSFKTLVDFFWEAHDPTTLNRQGADVGTQYRSAIFYETEEQREIAETSRKEASENFSRPIVTEITAAGPFYEAEDYHQEFYELNKTYPYCRAVITPKLQKLGLE
ncbi:peptide-methionine (S)-S-oxide reductase MsrA [Pelagicoccus sp. SDUM812002]|uniref:peptide-methionine (S)-S-oxide reductase MsrA n=1 Tax=Pelagicoccus sp. SDUM812002 TaxID=3041266 RepID=UPI00280E29E9|nr:peptide-methionine (S)-S-oxide reductase MsrA [Pelagicoccus sp. SDUM812002]MDQ8184520.1 peptide-methionine (S)-S-oxide reductase MsrA [Pelagicoccus sp. SDUM812002]